MKKWSLNVRGHLRNLQVSQVVQGCSHLPLFLPPPKCGTIIESLIYVSTSSGAFFTYWWGSFRCNRLAVFAKPQEKIENEREKSCWCTVVAARTIVAPFKKKKKLAKILAHNTLSQIAWNIHARQRRRLQTVGESLDGFQALSWSFCANLSLTIL